jgi:uncharacterized membrane protein YesL
MKKMMSGERMMNNNPVNKNNNMKLNKRAALLTLLTMSIIAATIVAIVTICLYVPTMYILGGVVVLMWCGIIRSIYRSFCGDDGFRK